MPSSIAPPRRDNTIRSVRDTGVAPPTEEPVLRTSILLELGVESKLGQQNAYHAQVALRYIQAVGDLAVAHTCLGMQQLVNDLGFFLR